ncbi:MAG: hypothetical protein JNJ71_04870 [Rubrivivax sp.]|nr:hypothetical protein [Rubrivivax sp.]
MSPLDAWWHIANLFLPALGVGLIAPALAKLLWRKALRGTSFGSLAGACMALGCLCMLGGLLAFGRDGRMATYGLLVLANAAMLGWACFGRRARGS